MLVYSSWLACSNLPFLPPNQLEQRVNTSSHWFVLVRTFHNILQQGKALNTSIQLHVHKFIIIVIMADMSDALMFWIFI